MALTDLSEFIRPMVGHRNEKAYQDLGAMKHLALMLSLTFYSGLWLHLYQFLTPHFHILPTNTGPVPQLLTYLPTQGHYILPMGQELSLAPYSLRTRLWAQQPLHSPLRCWLHPSL